MLTLFLSSPFDGCEEERLHFMTRYYATLQKMLVAVGVSLRAVDMRFGITEQVGRCLCSFRAIVEAINSLWSDAVLIKQMGRDDLTIMACMRGLDVSHVVLGYNSARY